MRMYKNLTNAAQGVVCFCLAMGLAGCSTTANKQDLVIKELKKLRSSVDSISEKLSEQEANREKLLSLSSRVGSSIGREINVEKLANIELPENPAPKDVKKYIQEIKSASAGQRGYSPNDPQIPLYAEVGTENLQLLIDSLSRGGYSAMNDYHIIPAITQLAEETHKPLILDSLPKYHALVKVVLEKGWEEDARDILLEELETGYRLSTDWIKAMAQLNDPESYPLLRDYFIRAGNHSQTYDAIKNLPIEDMSGAVIEAWKESQYEHEYERQRMAVIAVEYGCIDALESLIDALTAPSDSTSSNYRKQEMRFAVLKTTNFKGSNEELAEWLNTNKDHLQFDTESREFVIGQKPEQGKPVNEEE